MWLTFYQYSKTLWSPYRQLQNYHNTFPESLEAAVERSVEGRLIVHVLGLYVTEKTIFETDVFISYEKLEILLFQSRRTVEWRTSGKKGIQW